MILKINDRLKVRTIEFFNNLSLELRFDSIASSFHFDFHFNPENHDQEELACVSHFHEAIIEHNGERFLHGYIISQSFKDASEKQMAQFSGYSLTGVLEDCQIPPESYPLQNDGLSLRQIATRLLKPFGLKMVIDPLVAKKMDMPYAETTAEPTDTIKDYLSTLASQRDIILNHDKYGRLVFTQVATRTLPIFHVEEGLIGTEMTMSFSGQQIHSHITVVKQADSDGGNAGQYTIRNPFVPVAAVFRPKVVVQSSGDDNSTKSVAENTLAAELRNIVLTIHIDRWEIDGKIVRPNSIISVLNKELYIYRRTNFFIESVRYEGNSESQMAVLTCVLPCCYDGSVPKNIFVDPHKNSATGFTQNF